MSRIAVMFLVFALHAPMSFADTGDTGDWADTGETAVDGVGAAALAGDPGGPPSCAVAPSGGIAAVALALGLAIGRRG
ncbi:MAG: hypothetical protein JRI25_01780 [Deltaproteobacteria bacterium]|nr:hypothetical protein [Deltaproteobacteria bacterium]MBW2253310.1 hypothetical protein [Deltaproteobacteria bacterium]